MSAPTPTPPGRSVPAVTGASRRERFNFRLALWITGTLVIVATATVQVYDVVRRLEIVVETAQLSYANLVRTLAEQTAGTVQVIDVVLQDTAANQSIDLHRLSDRGLNQRLRDRVLATPQIGELIVLDAKGLLVAYSGKAPAQRTAWMDQKYFVAHRNAARGMYASDTVHRGKPAVALSRRIDDPGGGFLGVAVAFLDLEYFRRFYSAIQLDPESEVLLLRPDGALLVRHPGDKPATGLPFAEQSLFAQLLDSDATAILSPNPADGKEGIYAAQFVSGYPFAIGASVPRAAVIRPWRTQVLHSAVRTTLLCLSVALLMWLVLRELRRRETAEEGLRVQTALLDELFDSAPEAIVLLDLGQRVTRVNREFTALFGYGPAEVRGRPLDELIVPPDLRPESDRMARAVDSGHYAGGETERVRKDGARVHVYALVAPILIAGDRIATYGIFRDLSERRLAESERGRLELRLRHAEKLEAIGTMAGGIAHDFNNILAAVLGYGDMALNAAPDTGPLRRYIANVMSASHRARALADQILSYSRSAHGRHEVIDVSAVVVEALELVRASLPPGIKLEVSTADESYAAMADPTYVHQLVMNLCTNALHAMRADGTLRVSLDVVTVAGEKVLSHGTLAAGRYILVDVQDTGSGIDPAVIGRIFEPFFTTKESGTGTGLGLAMVQSIVTELGGAIDVRSVPGQGSIFGIYLPRSDAAIMEKTTQDAPLPRGAGEHVLVVQDEKPLMMLTEEMLAVLSYEPAGFTRAAEALEVVQSDPQRFDAAVVDHLMPGMSGVEFARRLHALRPEIPVLVISAYTGPLLNQEAVIAGVDEILTKPLDLRRLAQAMERALSRKQPH